jgi:pimeloyl-ACP methyl ester carboxylesterase
MESEIMPRHKTTISSDGVLLAVRDPGGSGRLVLLIHGLGLTQRSWARVSHRLEKRFRVVTYDQRGHGASARASDYSRSALLRDLEAVVAELALNEVVLVGHSLGGHLAVEYAAAHTECAGVVGVEGGVPVDLPAADWVRMEAGGRKLVADAVMALTRLLRLGSAMSYEEMKRLADENDQWLRGLGETYGRISCPVLLVLGSRADRVPQGVEIRESVRRGAQALQDAHPEVAVEWLPCGHFVLLERPVELAAKIEHFTESL